LLYSYSNNPTIMTKQNQSINQFENIARRKVSARSKKNAERAKYAKKRRQPPVNHPDHTSKTSFKWKISKNPEVKNSRSFRKLTWELEKIEREREIENARIDDIMDYYLYMEFIEQQDAEEQERLEVEYQLSKEEQRREADRLRVKQEKLIARNVAKKKREINENAVDSIRECAASIALNDISLETIEIYDDICGIKVTIQKY